MFHAEDCEINYADTLPSRRENRTPHPLSLGYYVRISFQDYNVEQGKWSNFTVETSDKGLLSQVIKVSISNDKSSWYYVCLT